MFIATVEFLSPEQGGRLTRPQSGYHPQIGVGSEFTSCIIESLNASSTADSSFEFGKDYRVRLRLLFPERYEQLLAVGSPVAFYEGSHLVGRGVIIEKLE